MLAIWGLMYTISFAPLAIIKPGRCGVGLRLALPSVDDLLFLTWPTCCVAFLVTLIIVASERARLTDRHSPSWRGAPVRGTGFQEFRSSRGNSCHVQATAPRARRMMPQRATLRYSYGLRIRRASKHCTMHCE
jgi:hypothetical protein